MLGAYPQAAVMAAAEGHDRCVGEHLAGRIGAVCGCERGERVPRRVVVEHAVIRAYPDASVAVLVEGEDAFTVGLSRARQVVVEARARFIHAVQALVGADPQASL